MKKRHFLPLVFIITSSILVNSQALEPGFNPNEYAELLRITARQRGPIADTLFPKPLKYDLHYNSPSLGMDNGWQLWISKPELSEKSAVISLRATTSAHSSWAENLYSTMVTANGSLQLEEDFNFQYQLSESDEAAIHVGWLIGTAYLQRDILPKIDSCYQVGIKDFIIFGHSQGGAISYLFTSYVYYLQKKGGLPSDIQFKTYGSAAPKPGNLFYAYDYENITQKGWGYNVINTEDWVPETPLSIQKISNFSESNPFKYIKEGTQSLPWIKRMVVRGKLNNIIRKINKSSAEYDKIMGKQFRSIVEDYIPEFRQSLAYESSNYQRCGNQITLKADEEYFKIFPRNNPNVFRNHMMDAYQLLLETHYLDELEEKYILYKNDSFPLYPNPEIPSLNEDQ